MTWLLLGTGLVLVYLGERLFPVMLRAWWLRQTHWNADRTLCWSTISAKKIKQGAITINEAMEECQPRMPEFRVDGSQRESKHITAVSVGIGLS